VGIIYQDDDYGQDGLTVYNESLSAYHLVDAAHLPVAPTATDFVAQVTQMKASGAQYVFLTTVPAATAKIIGTAAALGFSPQWVLQSPAYFTGLLAVAALRPLFDKKVWVCGQGAIWGDTSVPGMQALLAAVAKYAPDQKPDGFFQGGWTLSIVTAAIIKKALDNKDVSRAGLYKAYTQLGTVDVGGLIPPLQYGTNASQHVPSRDSSVFVVDSSQPTTVTNLSGDFIGTAAMASQF